MKILKHVTPKLILFFSSYIPLILIIQLQLLETLQKDINNNQTKKFVLNNYKTWSNLLTYEDFKYIIGLFLICIFLIICIRVMLNNSKDSNLLDNIQIKSIQNISGIYITNYLTVYIFPFITLNLSGFVGILTFGLLTLLVCHVFIKNDTLYINPILNIIFRYNIFSVIIEENDNDIEIILLSRKSRVKLKNNPYVNARKISHNIFIDL